MWVEEWGICSGIHASWSSQCLLINALCSSPINLCNGCNKWNKRGIWNELSKRLSYVTTHESKWFWNFCRGWLGNSGGRKVAGSSPVAPTCFSFRYQMPIFPDAIKKFVSSGDGLWERSCPKALSYSSCFKFRVMNKEMDPPEVSIAVKVVCRITLISPYWKGSERHGASPDWQTH